jgi:hypothetical protein
VDEPVWRAGAADSGLVRSRDVRSRGSSRSLQRAAMSDVPEVRVDAFDDVCGERVKNSSSRRSYSAPPSLELVLVGLPWGEGAVSD